MLKFLKDWTLPFAMLMGTFIYLLFAKVSLLSPLKPWVETTVSYLMPTLIFVMLFLTFCKVPLRQLLPCRWHLWLILIQTGCCLALAALLYFIPTMPFTLRISLEAGMACIICPTATAAAVITAKLGGNASSLTTYTILSNLTAAIIVPLVFPLVEPHTGITFWSAFFVILRRVFPLLICPFLAALLVRALCPRLLQFICSMRNAAFYLWSVALAIVVAQTIRSIVHSSADSYTLLYIGIAGLITCAIQFAIGKNIGGHYNDRISAGQALGQKNTIFAIWLSYTYLNPLSSLGPGSYVLWQNLVNSWQLWKKRKKEEHGLS